jgi:Zn-dependent M28 family amino/carboxypeptidase
MTSANTFKRALFTLSVLMAGCRSAAPETGGWPTRTPSEVARDLKRDIEWFADDAREGRAIETAGLDASAQYIADRFAKLGLRPVPGQRDFFQPFDFNVGVEVGPEAFLSINGERIASTDFVPLVNAAETPASGPLAFVGYGISSEKRDYDDFAGIDVKGKYVLVMRWEPHNAEGKSAWEPSAGWTAEAAIARKVQQAERAGAAGVILVNAPTHHDDVDRLLSPRGSLRRSTSIPVFHVAIEVADQMLAKANAPSLVELQKKIDESGKPASIELPGVDVSGKVEFVRQTKPARNVLAVLPGKGPRANEYVVVGAHYDHVGRGGNGMSAARGSKEIHNGADDNASGTAALLQIAEQFTLMGRQDRSILFCAFTLEEVGLIGSREMLKSPPVDKQSMVAMLNLDMVGRMRNDFLYVGGGGTAEAFQSILEKVDAASPIELKTMGRGGVGPSDHASFARERIPVLFFFSGMHVDYHRPTDDAHKINVPGVARIVSLSVDLIRELCAMEPQTYVDRFDRDETNVDVRPGETPSTRPTTTTSGPTRVQLGVIPSYTSDDATSGVLVDDTIPNTAARVAGVLAGDRIIKLNDRDIDNLYDLTAFLREANPGDAVAITVVRGTQTMTLQATLRARGQVD